MGDHVNVEVTGRVWGVFAHRLALETSDGKVLVDLGPKGAQEVSVTEGDRLTVRGARKPSEIKAETVVAADGTERSIAWPTKGEPAPGRGDDPALAVSAAQGEGYAVSGPPLRKPKHWEVLASRDGQDFVLHVELEGWIRKVKARSAESAKRA